jgi:hypothetical protein
MYFDNINGIRGAPLPDKEQEAQPITNDDNEWLDPDADDHNIKNNAIRLRETSPECGYYDGLGRRISEQEYQLELDYEVEHGVPYPPHLRPEARSLSLHAHSDTQCGGDAIGEITQPDVCYPVTKGMGVSVGSLPLPRNCEVLGYVGETCDDEPVEVVPLWRSKEGGCYAPLGTAVSAAGRTFFGSVLVECEPLVDWLIDGVLFEFEMEVELGSLVLEAKLLQSPVFLEVPMRSLDAEGGILREGKPL